MLTCTEEATTLYPERTRRRLATRDRVFDAALTAFQQSGVAAAQIEHIVKAAGVARGTFYLHFPTKDHVLIELLQRKQRAIAAQLHGMEHTSVAAFLQCMADLMIEDALQENAALWHELWAAIGRHAIELRTEANALVEIVVQVLSDAQQREEIREDISPFELTSVLLPGVYGLLQMKLDEPKPAIQHALYRVVDIFVQGSRRQ